MKTEFTTRCHERLNKKDLVLIGENILFEINKNDNVLLPLEKGIDYKVTIEKL